MKSAREKIMLLTLLGALVLWQVVPIVRGLVFDPLTTRSNRIESLELSIENKKKEQNTQKLARKRLSAWELRSLPPDPLKAPQLYDTWLTNLAHESKLTDVTLEASNAVMRPESDVYYSIRFKLKGKGSLENARDFLHAFHKSGLLHRVNRVQLDTKGDSSRPMDLEFDLEALSLLSSPERITLLADENSPLQPPDKLRSREEFDDVVQKNLFAKGYTGPPKPPDTPKERPKTTPIDEMPEAAEFVYLTMSVTRGTGQGAESDATLYDRASNKETRLTPGNPFAIAGLAGKVLAIRSAYIVLEIEGEPWRLELGENLKQIHKVPRPESTLQ